MNLISYKICYWQKKKIFKYFRVKLFEWVTKWVCYFQLFMDTLFYGCRKPTWGLICNVCELKNLDIWFSLNTFHNKILHHKSYELWLLMKNGINMNSSIGKLDFLVFIFVISIWFLHFSVSIIINFLISFQFQKFWCIVQNLLKKEES